VELLHKKANDGTLTGTEEANAIAAYHNDPDAAARIAKALFPDTGTMVIQPGFSTEITDIGDV